jgi:hypothetical protein
MMKKLKNLEFESVHPKSVLLASVVHGISCLFHSNQFAAWSVGLRCWLWAPNRPEKKNKKFKFYQAIRNQNKIFHGFNLETTTKTSDRNFARDFYWPKLRVKKIYKFSPEVSDERKSEKFSNFRAKMNYCA